MTRTSSPASTRFPEFRAWAREITQTDKEARRYGRSTDLNGQIARLLERAYQRGFEDAQTGADTVARQVSTNPYDPEPLPRSLIGTKIDGAFYGIGIRKFGSRSSSREHEPRMVAYVQDIGISSFSRTVPDWRLLKPDGSFEDQSYSDRTIRQMVKLGLLVEGQSAHPLLKDRNLLVMSPKGDATYVSLHLR